MAINQRKAGAILSYVQIILNNTVSLLYTPIALRMLGQSQYGLFGTASSLTSYLSLLSFGIGGAYLRWNMKYRAENDVEGERRLNGLFLTIFSVLSLITLTAGLILTFVCPYVFGNSFTDTEVFDLQLIVLMNIFSMSVGLFLTPVMSCIQAYEKFLIYRVVAIVNIMLTPVINLAVLFSGGKAVALSLATFIMGSINYLVYFVYARKRLNMRFIFKGFKLDEFKSIIFFSFFIFLNTITDLITSSTDSVLLGSMVGTVAVAVYTIGKNFQGYFSSFTVAAAGVFAPRVNEIVATKQDDSVLDELFLRVARIQFLIATLILMGYIAMGRQFIFIWAGDKYKDSFWVGLWLFFASFVPLFQNVGIEIQKAKNKHKFRSVVYFFIALGNIALTIPFIYLWGGVGAAFATFLCCILGQGVIMNIYYHTNIGLNMFKFWKGILSMVPGLILPTVLCALIYMYLPNNNIMLFLATGVGFVVVYILSVWFFSMNNYEKDLVKQPIQRLFSKFKPKK